GRAAGGGDGGAGTLTIGRRKPLHPAAGEHDEIGGESRQARPAHERREVAQAGAVAQPTELGAERDRPEVAFQPQDRTRSGPAYPSRCALVGFARCHGRRLASFRRAVRSGCRPFRHRGRHAHPCSTSFTAATISPTVMLPPSSASRDSHALSGTWPSTMLTAVIRSLIVTLPSALQSPRHEVASVNAHSSSPVPPPSAE